MRNFFATGLPLAARTDEETAKSRIPAASLVSSPFVSRPVLAGVRLLLGLYTLVVLIVELALIGVDEDKRFYCYFTNLTYTGLSFYFWLSGSLTLAAARKNPRWAVERWPTWVQGVYLTLVGTITTFPLVVTIVFWVILAPVGIWNKPYDAWSNLSSHAFNTMFSCLEILFTSLPALNILIYCPFMIILLACYLGLAYLSHYTQGFYTYEFLNPDGGPVLAGYIVGIAAAEVVIFGIVHLLVMRLRDWAIQRWVHDDPTRRELDSEKGDSAV